MKRTSLTTAVIAGLAGVAGIANMAGAVNLSTDGTGSVLIYPYYTVNGNNATLLSVVNTTSEGKAIKVRFLEAYNSREVLDFNLYMSPFDVWTAEVDKVGAGAGVSTADNSCTVPVVGSTPTPFVNYAYAGGNTDTGPTNLGRTTEGYVELIEMGTVNNNVAVWKGGGALDAITHSGGVPASCATVQAAWGYASGSQFWKTNAQTDIGAPDGGLFGSGTIVNVGQGTIEAYNAEALAGFYAANAASSHTKPGDILPNLSTGGNNIAYTFNTTGTGNVSLATTSFTASIDAVSAVFMTDNVYNEYAVDPAYGQSTEWVVTFPTKRFYVDLPIPGLARSKNAPTIATPPFDLIFGSGWNVGYAGTSCSPIDVTYFDREEGQPTSSPGFSPPPPGPAGFALCWEANVVSFDPAAGGNAPILASNLQESFALSAGYTTGWANFDFTNGVQAGQHTLAGINGNTFVGLPAVGFAVQQTINTSAGGAGVLANYTALYNHKYNRVCTNGQAACS
jgi:hypothetical protein